MTALKTLSMRLRGAKVDLEAAGEETDGMASSVSELQAKLIALTGVDIMKDPDTFKSTFEIIGEMSKVWDTVTDINKAAALELMGGKRQGNILQSMIVNFDDANKASQTAASSMGSAWRENEKYLESINGRIAQFKATFESIVNDLISGGTVSWFIQSGTTILDIIGKILTSFNGWTARIIALVALVKTIKSLKIITGLKNTFSITSKLTAMMGLLNKDLIAQIAAEAGVAISAKGATAAQREQIVQSLGLVNATKKVTGALWDQVASQAAALATNPVTWIAAATAGAVALGVALMMTTKTTQDYEKELEKSSERYKEGINEVKTLQDELDIVKRKIEELNANGKLTLTEENELRRLKAENAELSRRIALQQIANRNARSSTLTDFANTTSSKLDAKSEILDDSEYEKAVSLGINPSHGSSAVTGSYWFVTYEQGIELRLAKLAELRKKYLKADSIEEQNAIQKEIDSIENYLADAQKELTGYTDKISDIAYEEMSDSAREQYDRIQTIFDKMLVAGGNANATDILGQARFGKAREAIEELNGSVSPQNLFNLYKTNDSFKQFIDYLVEIGMLSSATDLANELSKTNDAAQSATDSLSAYANSIKAIVDIAKTLGDSSSKITNALKDIANDGIVSGAHMSDLFEEFATTEGFEEVIKTLTDGTASAAEMKSALENLWGSYIEGSGILSNVTEENYNYVVSLLRAHGVTNAQEVATQSLVKKLTDLAIADGVVTEEEWNKIRAQLESANVNAQLITTYEQLVRGVVSAQEKMNEAWAQGVKARLEAAKIDIQTIKAVAAAYNAPANAGLVDYESEQNALSKFKGKDLQEIIRYQKALSDIDKAQAELNSFLVNLNSNIDIDLSALDKSGSSSSSSSKDTVKDAFENARAVLDAEKEKLEAGMPWNTDVIKNTADYYNKLEILANKFYKNSSKHAEEYNKVMKEIAKGRFKLRQDEIKDLISDTEKMIEIWRKQDEARDNNGNYKNIIGAYDTIKKQAHAAAEEYRKLMSGVMSANEIENSDYIQEMQSTWWKADEQQRTETNNKFKKEMEYRQHLLEVNAITERDYVKWLNDAYQQYFGNQKKHAEDYRKYMEDVYDKLRNLYKKQLDKELDDLKNFYDKQKTLLDEQKSREENIDQENEKRKTVNELRQTIAELSRDTSTAAQKKMATLREQLADAEKDLADFERDNAYDRTAQMLEEWYKTQEETIQSKLDAIDEDVANLNGNTAGIYEIVKKWAASIGIQMASPPTYASGTMNSRGGYAVVGEHHKAELIAKRSGGQYQLLSPNSMVFNGEQTKSLWRISKNPAEFLASKLSGVIPARTMAGCGQINPIFNFDWTVMANDSNDFKNNLKSYSLEITKTVLEGLQKLK